MNMSYQTTKSIENPVRHRFRVYIVIACIVAVAALMTAWTTQQVSAGEQESSASTLFGSDKELEVVASYSEWQSNLLAWESSVEQLNVTVGSQGPLSYLPEQFGGYHSYLG